MHTPFGAIVLGTASALPAAFFTVEINNLTDFAPELWQRALIVTGMFVVGIGLVAAMTSWSFRRHSALAVGVGMIALGVVGVAILGLAVADSAQTGRGGDTAILVLVLALSIALVSGGALTIRNRVRDADDSRVAASKSFARNFFSPPTDREILARLDRIERLQSDLIERTETDPNIPSWAGPAWAFAALRRVGWIATPGAAIPTSSAGHATQQTSFDFSARTEGST